MKLKHKIFACFAALTVVTIGTITAYSTFNQSHTYIQNELNSQKQVINLLTNAVTGQYYNYLNQQILQVFSTRNDLKIKAQILQNFIAQINFNEENLENFLHQQQKSLNQVGLDLVVTKDDELILSPFFKDIFTALSVSRRNLIYTLSSHFKSSQDGYFLTLFNEQDYKSDYLSYSFKLDNYPTYSLALVQNIDTLLEIYNINDEFIIGQLRNNFAELGNLLNGVALIADGDHHQVLLASKEKLPFISLPEGLKTELQHKKGLKNITLNYKDHDYYVCFNYFKPLNWYIVTLRDSAEVIEPALAQAKIMLSIGIALLALALVFAILLANTLTKRLSIIALKAKIISRTVLSDPKAVSQITETLKLKGKDEVSEVSQAIASMGNSISDNVQKLMLSNKQRDRLQGELDAARQIQLGMLVPDDEIPSSDKVHTAAFLTPAKEVGGDFYDVFYLDDDRIAFCIGDVSDKGVCAALFMSMTISLVRSTLALGIEPCKVMELINSQLSKRNPNMMFVTMYIMVVNEKTGEYVASNAGHCLPILIKDNEIIELDELSGPAVGAIDGLEYTQYQGTIKQGESLLLYTDGVSEAQNEKREFFGVEKILDTCKSNSTLEPKLLLESVLDEVYSFRGNFEQSDDITLLCFKLL